MHEAAVLRGEERITIALCRVEKLRGFLRGGGVNGVLMGRVVAFFLPHTYVSICFANNQMVMISTSWLDAIILIIATNNCFN